MSALSRSSALFRSALRQQFIPRANLSSKPAKHVPSIAEQTIAMAAMFLAILGPSGWVLSHLEGYKKRP